MPASLSPSPAYTSSQTSATSSAEAQKTAAAKVLPPAVNAFHCAMFANSKHLGKDMSGSVYLVPRWPFHNAWIKATI